MVLMFMILYIVGYAVTASKRILTLLNEDELIEYRDTVQPEEDEGGLHSVIVLKEASFGWLKELSEEEKEKVKEKGKGDNMKEVSVSEKKGKGNVNVSEISRVDEAEAEAEAEKRSEVEVQVVGPNRSIYTLNQISFNALKGELVNYL
jgi:hypothetical protein